MKRRHRRTFTERPPLPGGGKREHTENHDNLIREKGFMKSTSLGRAISASPEQAQRLLNADAAWPSRGRLNSSPRIPTEFFQKSEVQKMNMKMEIRKWKMNMI